MNSKIILLFPLIAFLCSGCATTLYEASSVGNADKVKALMDNGADVNAADEKGVTPLMAAAKANHPETVALLLRGGADPHKKDRRGKTAIDHAFEQKHPETFILLLEKGSEIQLAEEDRPSDDTDPKIFFYDLADEHRLYRKIISESPNVPLRDFDAYFSLFSNGYYSADVRKRFETLLLRDFNDAGNPPDAEKMQAFIAKYSDMGTHYYLVTADSLNLRAAASPDAEWLGNYRRGDRVYALEENADWLRTEKGWISSEYTKAVRKSIPVLQVYMEKAEKTLRALPSPNDLKETTEKTESGKKNKRAKKAKKTVSVHKNRQKGIHTGSMAAARKELEDILDNPELEKLENFIRKYKDKEAYRSLLETAREKYKELLLEP